MWPQAIGHVAVQLLQLSVFMYDFCNVPMCFYNTCLVNSFLDQLFWNSLVEIIIILHDLIRIVTRNYVFSHLCVRAAATHHDIHVTLYNSQTANAGFVDLDSGTKLGPSLIYSTDLV